MCKGKIIALAVGVSLLFSSALASAQPGRPGPPWMRPEFVEKLELTDKQRDQVKDLFSGLEKKRIQLRADLQLKKLELREAMDSPDPDEGKVRKLAREMGSIRTNIHLTRIDQKLGLRKILTPEQLKQLRGFGMMRRMMGGTKGKMRQRGKPGGWGAPRPEGP